MGRPRGGGSGTSYGLRRRSGGAVAVVSPMLYNTGVELMMECFEDALSPSQIEAARKAKEEFKKAQKKIEEAKAENARAAAAAAAKAEAERQAAARAEAERQAEAAATAAAAAAAKRARQNSSGSTSPDIMIVGESPPRMGQRMTSPRPGQAAPKPVSGPIINSIATQGVLPPHVAGVPQEMYRFVNHGQNNNAVGQQSNQWFLRPIRPGMQGQMAPRASMAPGGPRQPGTPVSPNMVTIVSGTSGLGIKRAINSPEEAAVAPLNKRARGRFVTEGSNGSGGSWVPLDEYYYGKMEGDPTFTDEKGEFRFRCWICTKMLYNNIKAMMHLQGHIDSEKQQNLDLSDLTQCKHCYKQFDTPFEMQTHIEKVHLSNMNVLMCRICEKDHESRGALTNHMRQNHCACEMPYTCQLCHFRSSMYSDVVDHFKKKHDSSDSMLCLYCLRVFHVKFVSQGWGQTQVYYHHLLRHQSKTSNRKCTVCKLSFFNSQDMKNHRKIHHQPNQKGVIGVNQKQNTADQVMIKVPETGIVSSKSGGPKSLNAPTVSKVLEHRGLHLPAGTAVSYCFECKMLMNTGDHYKKYIQCSMCRFATSCSFAYATHMMGFHSGQLSALSHSVPVERALPAPVYCLCGFSSKFGNKTANHLVFCSKRTGYLNKPEAPPPEKPGPDEIDPRRKPDASILDVLGLVKKQSVVNTSVEEEEPVSVTKNIPDTEGRAHLTSFTEEYKMQHLDQDEETKVKAAPQTLPPDMAFKEDASTDATAHQHAPDTHKAASPPPLEDSSSAQNLQPSIVKEDEDEVKAQEHSESVGQESETDKEATLAEGKTVNVGQESETDKEATLVEGESETMTQESETERESTLVEESVRQESETDREATLAEEQSESERQESEPDREATLAEEQSENARQESEPDREATLAEEQSENARQESEPDREATLAEEQTESARQESEPDREATLAEEQSESARQESEPDREATLAEEQSESARQESEPDREATLAEEQTESVRQESEPDREATVAEEQTESARQELEPDRKATLAEEQSEDVGQGSETDKIATSAEEPSESVGQEREIDESTAELETEDRMETWESEPDKEAVVATETEDWMETEEAEPFCEDRVTSVTAAIPPEEGNSENLPDDVIHEEKMEVEEDHLSTEESSTTAVEKDDAPCPGGDHQEAGDMTTELQLEETGQGVEEKELMETDETLLEEDQDKAAQDDGSVQAQTAHRDVDNGRLPQALAQEPESAKDQDLTIEEEEELLGTGKEEAGQPQAQDQEPSAQIGAEVFSPGEDGDAPPEENDALATGSDEVLTLDEYMEGIAEDDNEATSEEKETVLEDSQKLVSEESKESRQDDREAVTEEAEDTSREQEQEAFSERTGTQIRDLEGEAEGTAAEESLPTEEGGESTCAPDTDDNRINADDQVVSKKDDHVDISEKTKPEDDCDLNRNPEPEDYMEEKRPEPTTEDKVADQTSGDASSTSAQEVPEDSAEAEPSRGAEDESSRETDSAKRTSANSSTGDSSSGPAGPSSQNTSLPGQPEESDAVREDRPSPSHKTGESDKPTAPPLVPPVSGMDKGQGPPGSSQYPHRPYPGSSSDRDRQHSRDYDHRDRSRDHRSRDHSHHQDHRRDRDYHDRNRDYYNRHNQYDRHRDQRYDNQQGRYQQGGYQQGGYQQGGYNSQDRYYNQNRPGNRGGQNRHGYNDRNYYRGYY